MHDTTPNAIYCDGTIIPKVDDDELYFLNKMTILYGSSGTGKSSIISHIINTLRDYIPAAIICNPTNAMNGDYNNIFPEQAIHDDLKKELLLNIFERQSNMIAMHSMVRNLDNLRPLFRLIASAQELERIEHLNRILHEGLRYVEKNRPIDEHDELIADLKQKHSRKALRTMRNAIKANIRVLLDMDLSEMQKSMLLNFSINPNLLLIVDDCAATIKEWKDLTETKKLFFQGRHYKVTVLLTMQNEAIIPPPLRQNAHISIFTTEKNVNAFFGKKSSGTTSQEVKKMMQIASVIFAQSNNKAKPNYKKLVVFGALVDTPHKVQFMLGNPKKRRFGSDLYWKLCEGLKNENIVSANTNRFNKMFNMKTSPKLIC